MEVLFSRKKLSYTHSAPEMASRLVSSKLTNILGFIESNNLHFIRITETNPMLIWEIFVNNSSLEKFRVKVCIT
ncbi:hypothetical protein YC68_23765 [Vibrio parahaemolyticus]|nr:hypothetical protein YC68_23765 [Vibrio parahaemolyticus]